MDNFYPPVEYVKQLLLLVKEFKLDQIDVGEVHIKMPKTVEKIKRNNSADDDDPSVDQVMNWSLSEPIPHQTALAKAFEGISSEPKPTKRVRKVDGE